MKAKLNKWYLILSAIWAVFWALDIFFLVPINGSALETFKEMLSDSFLFYYMWFWIMTPFILYCTFLLLYKLYLVIKRKLVP